MCETCNCSWLLNSYYCDIELLLTAWKLRLGQMELFRRCWKAQGNDKRTDTKDT